MYLLTVRFWKIPFKNRNFNKDTRDNPSPIQLLERDYLKLFEERLFYFL